MELPAAQPAILLAVRSARRRLNAETLGGTEMRTRVLATVSLLAVIAAAAAGPDPFARKEITAYPFVAPKARADSITANFGKVVTGMTAAEVTTVLGEPDEVRPLYEPQVKNAKQIGHTFWYVIRRIKASGSASEKNESVVRVSFDNDGRVTNVAHW